MRRFRTHALGAVCALVTACSTTDNVTRETGATDRSKSDATQVAQPGEQRFTAFITAYSYWDNTPRGSAAIARPVIHRRAGGVGTYDDPVTIAVGHVIRGGRQTLDYPAGTRFYLPHLRKYAIVEDVCGDGNRPQDGPCHSGYQGNPWLDIYIDGQRSGQRAAHQCAYHMTRVTQIIRNPQAGYPVTRGPITESGCQVYSG